MNKTDIRRIRAHIKTLAGREDRLRKEMQFPGIDNFHFLEREVDALEWALSVLVPLVKLKEAKIERERMAMDQNSKGKIKELD